MSSARARRQAIHKLGLGPAVLLSPRLRRPSTEENAAAILARGCWRENFTLTSILSPPPGRKSCWWPTWIPPSSLSNALTNCLDLLAIALHRRPQSKRRRGEIRPGSRALRERVGLPKGLPFPGRRENWRERVSALTHAPDCHHVARIRHTIPSAAFTIFICASPAQAGLDEEHGNRIWGDDEVRHSPAKSARPFWAARAKWEVLKEASSGAS